MKFFKKLILIVVIFTLVSTTVFIFPKEALAEATSYELILNGTQLTETGFYEKGTPYLPVSMINKYFINSSLSLDSNNHRLIINTGNMKLRLADTEITNFVKKYSGDMYIPLATINGIECFPLNTTNSFYRLTYSIIDEKIVIKRSNFENFKIAQIYKSGVLVQPSLNSESIETFSLAKDQDVIILAESKNYYKIRLDDNTEAFIKKSDVQVLEVNPSDYDFYSPKKKKFDRGNSKISLAWQYVDEITPAAPDTKVNGIDILSPTWFDQEVNGNGNIENHGDKGYTDLAHTNGYMVWATITNNMSEKGSTLYTTSVLNNSALVNKTIAQYIFYSCLYNVDGINIDYETLQDSDAEGFVAFTAAFRNLTERQGFVLSVDTTIPRPWTIEYNRKELAKYVDYLALMTYDEHWGSSPIAGSVASYPWVLDSIIQTLEDVPSEKLLLGVPLYMREWQFDTQGKLIKSRAYTMETTRKIISDNGLTPVWLPEVSQYYVEYTKDGIKSKIWIEDRRSIAHKLAIVSEYNLAGAAAWQFGQGEEKAFAAFDGILKKNKSAADYDLPY